MSQRLKWKEGAWVFGICFVLLTLFIVFFSHLANLVDVPAAHILLPLQTYHSVQVFLAITELGSTTGIVVIALGAAYFLRREQALIARLVLALVGSSIVAESMKLLIDRGRPEPLLWVSHVNTYSFPSGHATSSMVLYGFLAIVFARLLPATYKRWAVFAAAIVVILSIGLSRIILGEHFLTDVVGGYLLGALWLSLIFWLPIEKWLAGYPQPGAQNPYGTDREKH